jgi:hypothetical protein
MVAELSALVELAIGKATEDLAPLAKLARLEALYATQAKVKDRSPLAGLTALQTLVLEKTGAKDRSLSLNWAQVTGLSPLHDGCALLKFLDIRKTLVTYEELQELTRDISFHAELKTDHPL